MKSKVIILALIGGIAAGSLSAADNPLAKTKAGDWAKYLVSRAIEGNKILSFKDAPKWWIGSPPGDSGSMRLDMRVLFQKQKVNGGGDMLDTRGPFEPILWLRKSARTTVVSETRDVLKVRGTAIECTKIVRKIESEGNELTPSYNGASTIWISDSVPLGLVRMENDYLSAAKKGAKETDKIKEVWALDEYGFGNYTE